MHIQHRVCLYTALRVPHVVCCTQSSQFQISMTALPFTPYVQTAELVRLLALSDLRLDYPTDYV